MNRSLSDQSPHTKVETSNLDAEGRRTDIPHVESMILPDMFEVPESWRQFVARMRARLGRPARHH